MSYDPRRPELVLPPGVGEVRPDIRVECRPRERELRIPGVAGDIVLAIRDENHPRLTEWLVSELADRQEGTISRRQLLACELSRSMIGRWLDARRLRVVHRGVYAVGHDALRLKGYLYAALLAAGEHSALSHGTGSAWLCLRRGFPSKPHLSAPRSRARGPTGIALHRPRLLLPEDVLIHDGLPVTSVARTLLDLSAVENAELVRRTIGEAQKHGIFDADEVRAVIARNVGHRGRKPLELMLEGFKPELDLREELEKRFHALMKKATDLPPYKPNHPFGPYLLDAFFEEHRVAVELDGYGTHHDVATFVGDRQRDRHLLLQGITNVRFTWWDVDEAPETLRVLLLR